MKTHKLIIAKPSFQPQRRRDPQTKAVPQFYKEATGFDKPTTFCMTVEENKRFCADLFLSNCPK